MLLSNKMENIKVVVIDRYGGISDSKLKEFNENELYKKAGFKTNDEFKCRHTWKNIVIKETLYEQLSIYAKTKGNAGKENKYDLPPPVDTALYFGNMLVIHYDKEKRPKPLTKSEWDSIYNSLMGGFESLGDEDDDESDEEVDPSELTKQGYKRDGFIVDDDEEIDELEYDSELSIEDYFD